MKKYEILKGDKDTEKNNKWWRYCESRQTIPFVIVKRYRKYARIEFDYLTLNNVLREVISGLDFNEFLGECTKIFDKYSCKKSHYSISLHIVNFWNIPMENAEEAAEELYDLIWNYLHF